MATATVSKQQIIRDFPGLVAAGNTMAECADALGLKTPNLAQRVTAIREELAGVIVDDSNGTVDLETAKGLALTAIPKPKRATGPRGPRAKDTSAYRDLVASLLESVNGDDD